MMQNSEDDENLLPCYSFFGTPERFNALCKDFLPDAASANQAHGRVAQLPGDEKLKAECSYGRPTSEIEDINDFDAELLALNLEGILKAQSTDPIESDNKVQSPGSSALVLQDSNAQSTRPIDPVRAARNRSGLYGRWSLAETAKFYELLRAMGADFPKIAEAFPKRTIRGVRTKFQREVRAHPEIMQPILAPWVNQKLGFITSKKVKNSILVRKSVHSFANGITMTRLVRELYDQPSKGQKIVNCTLTPENLLIPENMVVYDENLNIPLVSTNVSDALPVTLVYSGNPRKPTLVVGDKDRSYYLR